MVTLHFLAQRRDEAKNADEERGECDEFRRDDIAHAAHYALVSRCHSLFFEKKERKENDGRA